MSETATALRATFIAFYVSDPIEVVSNLILQVVPERTEADGFADLLAATIRLA